MPNTITFKSAHTKTYRATTKKPQHRYYDQKLNWSNKTSRTIYRPLPKFQYNKKSGKKSATPFHHGSYSTTLFISLANSKLLMCLSFIWYLFSIFVYVSTTLFISLAKSKLLMCLSFVWYLFSICVRLSTYLIQTNLFHEKIESPIHAMPKKR